MITHGSLFSGIGGFDLGFERSGIETLWSVEIDPQCNHVRRRHFSKTQIFTDVRGVGAHNLAPVDVISFGSPCQDLSVAGKRKGIHDGARSNLFFEAVRVVRELKPRLAIWENVPGTFSSDDGRDFAAVLRELAKCGALDIGWRVLDSQWVGVAQRRRRVFVVADFGGERAEEILALSESLRGYPAPRRETGKDVAGTLESRVDGGGFPGTDGACSGHVVPCVIKGAAIGRKPEAGPQRGEIPSDGSCYTLNCTEQHAALVPEVARTVSCNLSRGGIPSTDGLDGSLIPEVAGCLEERDSKGADSDTKPGHLVVVRTDNTSCNGHGIIEDGTTHTLGGATDAVAFQPGNLRRKAGAAPSTKAFPTLGSEMRGDQFPHVASGMIVRRLTPTECERLQGFPDGWTEWGIDESGTRIEMSDSARYRMLGNAVTVNVAQYLGQKIAAAIIAAMIQGEME